MFHWVSSKLQKIVIMSTRVSVILRIHYADNKIRPNSVKVGITFVKFKMWIKYYLPTVRFVSTKTRLLLLQTDLSIFDQLTYALISILTCGLNIFMPGLELRLWRLV
jgi:hypothetical protein